MLICLYRCQALSAGFQVHNVSYGIHCSFLLVFADAHDMIHDLDSFFILVVIITYDMKVGLVFLDLEKKVGSDTFTVFIVFIIAHFLFLHFMVFLIEYFWLYQKCK